MGCIPRDHATTKLIADEGQLSVTAPVLMEPVAVGVTITRARFAPLLLRFPLLRFDAAAGFDRGGAHAASLPCGWVYARGMVDCVIAPWPGGTGPSLFAQEVDLLRLAQISGIDLDRASAQT